MKVILVGLILVVCVHTAPVTDDAQATITDYKYVNDGSGNYEYSFKTSNGLSRFETGEIKNRGQDNEFLLVKGEYSYLDVDGQLIIVRYKADENGYQINPPLVELPQSVLAGALPPNLVASIVG